MPLALSQWEGTAQAFLTQFPLGTIVGGDEVLAFAEDHENGLAADLLIGDPAKRLNTIKRHINHGAASRNFSEAERFILAVEDVKHKTFLVQKFSEYYTEFAKDGIDKSVSGAMSPLNSRIRGLESVKKEELPAEEQEAMEKEMQELVGFQQSAKPFLSAQVTAHYIRQLTAGGMSEEEATRMLQQNMVAIQYNRVMKKLR